MHLHPRRHFDGSICSAALHPDCWEFHHWPKHRGDGPSTLATNATLRSYTPKHRRGAADDVAARLAAAERDGFGYMVTDPNRITR